MRASGVGSLRPNPSASTGDYERLADQLYDEHLLEQARTGRDAEVAALRRSGDYGL